MVSHNEKTSRRAHPDMVGLTSEELERNTNLARSLFDAFPHLKGATRAYMLEVIMDPELMQEKAPELVGRNSDAHKINTARRKARSVLRLESGASVTEVRAAIWKVLASSAASLSVSTAHG